MRVLVVDDSPAVRARLVARLREVDDVDVVEAWDGDEAVRLARVHAPDVLVLDLNLPGLGGLEVLALLKAERLPPLVIVLTNHPHDRYRLACLQAGADYFFDKACDFDLVAPTVASAGTRRP